MSEDLKTIRQESGPGDTLTPDLKFFVQTLSLREAFDQLDLPELQRNLFSSKDWLSVILKTYNIQLFVKYIKEDEKISSYIIYSVVDNFLERKICICSYCDYFDCHVQSPEHWRALFESLREDYPDYRIAVRSLYDNLVQNSPDFKELSREKHHLIDVRDDIEILWKNAFNNFKGAYKQALKSDLRVERCKKDALRDFFLLHLNVRRLKHGIFPQPYRFFEHVWDQYIAQDKGMMFAAYNRDNEMVAAQVYLICGDTLYYKFSTSNLDYLKLRPNNLLSWEGVKYAKERGLSFIDMGSSEVYQHGLMGYKKRICRTTTERDIIHMGFAPEDYVFSKKRILRVFTKCFTRRWMPVPVVEWGSNFIYRYLA